MQNFYIYIIKNSRDNSRIKELNMSNIESQLNIHIIPFAYKQSFDDTIETLKSLCDESKLWEMKDIGDNNLLDHIKNLISVDNNCKSTIGKKYTLTQKGRGKLLNLSNNWNEELNFKDQYKNEFKISIEGIDLFLFESQIGFLTLKISDKTLQSSAENQDIISEIDSVIKLNYSIKHLIYEDNELYWNKKISKTETKTFKSSFLDIVCKLTSNLSILTFFDGHISDSDKNMSPNKTIVYSNLILNKCISEEEIYKKLYYMRRVFKDSYRIPHYELNDKENSEVYKIFENIYWGIAQEGVASIAYYDSENIRNEEFIKNNHLNNLENSYLYLYIIILNIRYSLLRISLLCAELPKEINKCIEIEKNEKNEDLTISKIEEIMSFFRLRGIFREVSNVTHQNNLYKKMWSIYNIDILLEELDSQIKVLSVVTSIKKAKIEKELLLQEELEGKNKQAAEKENNRKREELEKRISDLVVIITTLFASISTISSTDSVADITHRIINKILMVLRINYIIPKGYFEFLYIILIGCSFIYFIKKYRDYWKEKRKLLTFRE